MNHRLAKTLLCTGFIALALTLPVSARSLRQVAAGKHCVAKMQQLIPGVPAARITNLDCYETFSDAIYAATDGAIWLPTNESLKSQLDILDRELMLSKATPTTGAPYVLAVDYRDANYAGPTLTYTGDAPCSAFMAYELADLEPLGWNDTTSSTRGYSSCDTNIQYEHANFGGAVLTCTPDCAGFGALNDKISSRRWFD